MALDIVATLRTAYEDCVREFQEYQALYREHGESPDFQIEGVGVSWAQFEDHLLNKIKAAQEAYLKTLEAELAIDQYTNGPVMITSQGI